MNENKQYIQRTKDFIIEGCLVEVEGSDPGLPR